MFDLRITDLSKTEEEGNIDFIALTNEQWAMIKTNIDMLKKHEKCELMYVEDFEKSIDKVRADAVDEVIGLARTEIDFESQAEQKRFVEFMEQLKSQKT